MRHVGKKCGFYLVGVFCLASRFFDSAFGFAKTGDIARASENIRTADTAVHQWNQLCFPVGVVAGVIEEWLFIGHRLAGIEAALVIGNDAVGKCLGQYSAYRLVGNFAVSKPD